ncbi:MAG: hypothetical protein HY686_07340 [Chloroflexi bacterium]|nr:hypothetical protein [Chloroflexota bacterium]
MLFMVTQTHTPATCPKDEGGADTLIEVNVAGVKVKGRWGSWASHTVWYLVETNSTEDLQKFLDPGMKRCTCTILPVSESPLPRAPARKR